MPRLIDADEVMRDAEHISAFRHGLADLTDLAIALSGGHTIEAEPVRHGRWVMTLYATTSKRNRVISNKKFACSECGYSNGRKQSNYCPNCGCKMDGDSHD